MDRNEPDKLPTIQISFIQHLVSPLFHACAEAGIIPGEIEDSEQEKVDTGKDEADLDGGLSMATLVPDSRGLTEDDVMEDMLDEAHVPPVRKVVSIILSNLQMNFESWQDEERVVLERQKQELQQNQQGELGELENQKAATTTEEKEQLVVVEKREEESDS